MPLATQNWLRRMRRMPLTK